MSGQAAGDGRPEIRVDGELASVTFGAFDLPAYDLFLQIKRLPESQVAYDWERDAYTVTTPARLAAQIGLVAASTARPRPAIAPHLHDYQAWVLGLALEAKRFALWLDTGLGKTAVYLEWARQVVAMTDGRVLILAPPQVIPQVQEEATRFYGAFPILHLASREELAHWCRHGAPGVAITKAPAVNDYLMIFRKPGQGRPVPALYDAKDNPEGWVTTDEWIRDARGVWADIRETDTLTGWQGAREEGDEKHVCPLQLEVIRRCVRLYSNPGDTVLDPFMGIGSTGWVAIEQGRHAVGFELKESYYAQACRNCELALTRRQQAETLPLFEGIEVA